VDEAEAAYEAAMKTARARARPPLDRPSGSDDPLEPDDAERISEAPAADRSVARAAGTAVHRFLQSWDGGGDERAVIDTLKAHAATAAGAMGCDAKDVLRESSEIVRAFLRSELAVRFRALIPLAREVSGLLERDGVAWRGTLDLVYRDAGGTVVVADFKTNRSAGEGTVATYRAQLEVYREMVQRALRLSRPPACELWWLRRGAIERW
jgi:ATP-dependent exoDNAse (exonuclease V) beta subunit